MARRGEIVPRSARPDRCEKCPYRKGRTVGSTGPVDAQLCIIGEAPGREELTAGRPFVGRSGKLLNAALEKAGIKREEAFLTNALLCQPTESPSKAAIDACRERLTEEVLAHPRKVILTLGNPAAKGLTGDHNFKITSKRGKPVDLEELGIWLPTLHPAAILRAQGEYPRWIEDIKYVGRLLGGGSEAIKRPDKPKAWILLADPNEETYYPKLGAVRAWGEDAPRQPTLHDWPETEVVAGIPAAVQAVNFLLAQPELSADIETGFSYSPRLGRVIALSVAYSPIHAVVFSEGLIHSTGFRKHLVRLLVGEGPQWVGHNFKYDSSYLRHQILGAEWPTTGALANAHDTILEHYCLNESKGTHDLEQLARDLLGAEDYKKIVKRYTLGKSKAEDREADKGYENVPREILYPYAALDTCHTFSIHRILCPQIQKSKSLTRLYEGLLLPGSRFLQRVQDNGLWVDQEFIQRLDDSLGGELKRALKKLNEEVHKEYDQLWPLDRSETTPGFESGPLWDTDVYMASQWATKKRPDDYNAGNWRHTSFVLYRLIGWAPMNTNERTLRDLDLTGRDQSATFGYKAKNYARGHPNRKVVLNYGFIQALIDVRLAQTAWKKLVKGTRDNLEPDGRLHTTFDLFKTETGRLSSTGPNLQNLPVPEKDDPMPARDIVGAPPGRVIIEADYSQVELRLLAHFSSDPGLIDVYNTGRDLHTELSIAIWGPGYTNYQRVRAKAVNFGIAYGRGAGSIAAEHDIPEEEAEEMRKTWFATFAQAAVWLDELHQAPMTGRTVITAFGRRRRFGVVSRDNYYELKNQSANFPMQSTASDLTLYSAMRAQEKWLKEGVDAQVVCLVHDAVVVECPEAIAQVVADQLQVIMEDTPRRILQPVINFPVDVHIGRRWGTLKLEEMAAPKKGSETSQGQKMTKKSGIASGRL